MGIYSSDNIYGIQIFLINSHDYNVNLLFKIKMKTLMSDEKKKEAKIFYNGLSKIDKTKIRFKIYIEGSSTYNNEIFMMWEEITLDYFLQKFDI
jgi:hypothetical protein